MDAVSHYKLTLIIRIKENFCYIKSTGQAVTAFATVSVVE